MSFPRVPAAESTAANALSWRLERMKKPNGMYYILSRGPRDDRESIALGYLSPVEADAALAGIEWLRERGTATGGYPTPDRLVLYLRGAGTNPDAKAEAREAVLRIIVDLGRALVEAGELVGTLDGAALAALLPNFGIASGDLPLDYPAMTLRQYVDSVWSVERKRTKATTWRREERLWASFLFPTVGGLRLRDIDGIDDAGHMSRTAHVHFDQLVQRLTLKSGAPASGNTKRLVRAAYQACLTNAVRSGHLGAVHSFFDIKGSTQRVLPEALPLSADEVHSLLDGAAIADTSRRPKDPVGMHRCLFAVAVSQGLRPAEARRLEWSHVDLEKRRLRVPGSKTKLSKATIPLFPLAVTELRRWWIACSRPSAGHVFTWRGLPLKGEAAYRRSLATAARAAGIDRKVTPYLLRHTFATRSLEAGATREDVAAVMRHSNPRMVAEHYDHADTSTVVDATAFETWQGEGK